MRCAENATTLRPRPKIESGVGGEESLRDSFARPSGYLFTKNFLNVENPVNIMPAPKPHGLITRHQLTADRQKRAAGEAALQPRDPLQQKPPERLHGHDHASALWRQLILMYTGLAAEIVSNMDQDMLVDYCLLDEQCIEMDKLRQAAMRNYTRSQRALDRRAESKTIDIKSLARLQDSVNWCLNEIVKLDARVDRKRALLHTLRQSLYLTPRSRAGVTPPEKGPEEPASEMDKILEAAPKMKPKNA
jgi:hypothetical protein